MILALILALVSSGIPFLSAKVRNNKHLALACFLVVVVRQLATVGQVLTGGLPTVDSDPIEFQLQAADNYGPLARTWYGQFLVFFYSMFGASHFLGCELSQTAFSVGLLVFIELIHFFKVERHAGRLVLLFGLLPSVILNTSVTLREAYQVMAFLAFTLGLLRSIRDGLGSHTALIPVAALILTILHQGFTFLVLVLIPLGILWMARDRPHLFIGAIFGTVILVGLGGNAMWSFLARDSVILQRIEAGEGIAYIDNYQEGVEKGRSTFGTMLDAKTPQGLISTGPIVLMNYLFAPFPWQVRGAKDVYGLFESAVRIYLFWHCISYLQKRSGPVPRRYRLLCFGLYILVEMMWAAGTANWGTAFRHRVVGYGLLVVLAGGGFPGHDSKTQLETTAKRQRSSNSLRARIRERRRSGAAPRRRKRTSSR